MRFVVTGGAGFIGSNIVKELVKEKHDVVVVDNLHTGKLDNLNDVIDDIELKKISILEFDEIKNVVKDIDGVFHEAALTVVQESFEKREEYWDVNVRGTENILKLAESGGFKLVFASSSSVYGNTTKIPIKEDFERNPINPYGQTKLEDEHLSEKYYESGVSSIGLRYFNVYGEGQNPSYAGVITKFMGRIAANLSPIIYGDGLQVRDFVYVKDVAKANVKAMTSSVKHGFFNIGSGNSTSIKELCYMMIRSSGLSLKPIFKQQQEGDIKLSQADINFTKKTLSWQATTKLEEWLKEAIPKILSVQK